jgi:autotransporter-associated beta strand protein
MKKWIMAVLLVAGVAQAAVKTWSGTVDTNFATAGNWSGVNFANMDSMVFSNTSTAGTSLYNNLDPASFAVNGISYSADAPAYTLSGNQIKLWSAGATANITTLGANAQNINNDINLNHATLNRTITVGATAPLMLNGIINNSASATNGITKAGSGALTLSGANTYGGSTTISAGTVKLGADNVLGTGQVIMTAAGVALSSDSVTARLLTNNLIAGASVVLGDAVSSGTLTLGGVVDLTGGAGSIISNNSRVVITGTLTNSVVTGFAFRKWGAGDLVIAGDSKLTTPTTGSLEYIKDGSLVVDGATLTCNVGFFQLVGNAPNSVARLVVTNGGSLLMTGNNAANWRVGVNGQGGSPTATNIFEIAGVVKGINSSYVANANQLFMGAGGTIAIVNLWSGGELTVRGVRPSDSTAAINSEFNFRGGTLKAFTNDTAFIAGLTNCFVGTGGGTIDSAGFDITIPQSLRDGAAAGYGSGGITKSGTGTLTLSDTNTYSGGTTVSMGTLIGNADGALGTGNVTVLNNATLVLQNGATHNYISSNSKLILGTNSVLNLNFTGAGTVGEVSLDGGATWLAGGTTYTAAQLTAAGGTGIYTGSGSFTVVSKKHLSLFMISSN